MGAHMRVKVMKSQVGTWHGAEGIVGIMWCAAERGEFVASVDVEEAQ